MPWFKVDDNLAFHAKVIAAGNEAMGAWVRAGSWSAQLLTEGRVPEHMVSLFGGREVAERLVEVGLWERDGADYVFHEWADRQPSREQVEADRAAARDRQAAARERARERREGASRRESQSGHGVSHGVTDGVTHADVTGVVTVPPTRPDPTRPTSPSEKGEGARKRATRIPDEFFITEPMKAWAAQEVPGLDVVASTRTFVDYWRGVAGAKGTKLDWIATWRNWLRRDFERLPSAKVSNAARAAQVALVLEAGERGQIGA